MSWLSLGASLNQAIRVCCGSAPDCGVHVISIFAYESFALVNLCCYTINTDKYKYDKKVTGCVTTLTAVLKIFPDCLKSSKHQEQKIFHLQHSSNVFANKTFNMAAGSDIP